MKQSPGVTLPFAEHLSDLMVVTGVFAAAVLFVICLALVTHRLGTHEGGPAWAIGWAAVYISGVCAMASVQWPWFGPLYPLFGTAFAGLIFVGALRFAGYPVPRWLPPLIATIAITRAIAEPYLSYVAVQTQAFGLLAAASIGASWIIRTRRHRADATMWEAVLGWSFPLIPLAHAGLAVAQAMGGDPSIALLAWVIVGLWVAGLQSGALLARAAIRAEQSRNTLESLVDTVPAGLALGDHDGRIRATNAAFAELVGIANPALLVGRPLEEVTAALREALADETSFDDATAGPQELRLRDGRIVILDRRSTTGHTEHGAANIWLLRDVTEERRLTEALDRSRRLETLGRLAGGVAHDFNNKLTVILGGAALLRPALEQAEPKKKERLDDLETAAHYCADLTRDLLDFAKKSPREPKQISTTQYLLRLAEQLRRDLPRGVALEATVSPKTPDLEADAVQLERVLTNLVYNARDALGSSGHIEIRADAAGEASVAITVRDDGPGMDPATSERAFDPFFTTKGPGGGTGLGLAIVFSLVESNGGEVSLETAPGAGAAFRTVWPRYGQAALA